MDLIKLLSFAKRKLVMELQVFWIRHAHSCGNAKEFSPHSKMYKAMFLQTLNPQISDLGVLQVQQARQALDPEKHVLGEFLSTQMDLVCSSNMMRAIETAYHLFPDRTVTVLPYVGERTFAEVARRMNWDVENQAETVERTAERLREMQYDTGRLDYALYRKVSSEYRDSVLRPDFRKFIEHVVVSHWLNTHSAFHLSRPQGRPFRVAIVSHGNFLLDMIQHQTSTPTSIWTDTPYFVPEHCLRPHYRPQRPALGNLGMTTTLWTRREIEQFALRHQRHLPPVLLVYETNAVYDHVTRTCLEYDGKRFVRQSEGRKHHVRRCHPWIRNMATLKD